MNRVADDAPARSTRDRKLFFTFNDKLIIRGKIEVKLLPNVCRKFQFKKKKKN